MRFLALRGHRPLRFVACVAVCLVVVGGITSDSVAGNLAEIDSDWFASLTPGAGIPIAPAGFTDGHNPTFAYTVGWGRKLSSRWNWTILNFGWRLFGRDDDFIRDQLEARGDDRDTPLDGGSLSIFSLTSELNLNVAPQSLVNPYVAAGVGLYPFSQETLEFAPGDSIQGISLPRRQIGSDRLSRFVVTGESPTVNFRSRTPLGVNFGGGLEFYLSEGAAFVIEGRYHILFMDVDEDRQLIRPEYDQRARRADTIHDLSAPHFITATAGVRLFF